MQKTLRIFIQSIPVLIMIGLIPLVLNDYLLTLLYIVIIIAALSVKKSEKDFIVLLSGFFIMIISEYIFVSTGVETFTRNTLLGLMPIWLPFLWGYSFIVISRSLDILKS